MFQFLKKNFSNKKLVFKYIVSGAIGGITNIFAFYLLTEVAGLWYMVSALLAFVFAFVVNFLLHKLWTFGSTSFTGVHRQAAMYLAVTLGGLLLNLALLSLLVEVFLVWPLLAQLASLSLVAFFSFLVNKNSTFKVPTGFDEEIPEKHLRRENL